MKKTLLILAMVISCMMASCNKNNNESNNPFVGVWKEDGTKWEFKENGEFIRVANYYLGSNIFTDTGSYTYNAQSSTFITTYDKSGRSYMRIVQHCSNDKIVYYDPTDMYIWTLIRVY